MPVILVARVEDEAQIGGLKGADQGGAVHHLCHAFKAFGDFDVIDRCVNGGEGAQNLVGANARFKGRVAFGVPGFGLRHTTRHPDDDDGVCRGWRSRTSATKDLRRRSGQRAQSGAGSGAHKPATAHA